MLNVSVQDKGSFRMRSIIAFSVLTIGLLLFLFLNQSNVSANDAGKTTLSPWPPVVGETYPDLELIDQMGNPFRLSALKGKVILLEPVGMTCPACQAFSGAHDTGPFGGGVAGRGLNSVHKLLPKYSNGFKIPHRDVVLVQVLLYDMRMGAPSAKDAAAWAKHFGLKMSRNEIVAVSPYDLRSKIAYNLIPGFQLIDRNFVLRSDSSGHHPKNNLYTHLFPLVPKLVNSR